MTKKNAVSQTGAQQQSSLEDQLRSLFPVDEKRGHLTMARDLRQPSPLLIVHTVVTYGGYEDPI